MEQAPTKYNILDAAVHQDDLQVVQEVLAPLARYILRQRSLLEKLSQDVARRNELVEALIRCETLKEECEIMEEMEALEADDPYLAFAAKGVEDQHKFILAASYSDAWTQIYDMKGDVLGALLSWHVC